MAGDVEKRTRTQTDGDAHQHSALLLSQILDALGDGLVCFDDSCRCSYLSSNAEAIFGNRAKDLLGRTCTELFPQASCHVDPEHSGEVISSFQYHSHTLEAWYKCVCYCLPGERCIYFRNITDSREMEDQLLAAQERSRLAQRAGGVGVFDWDAQANRVVWTEQLEELYGIPRGSFEGTYEAWLAKVHPDDAASLRSLIEQAVQQHAEEIAFEYQFIRSDGIKRWMSARSSLMYADNGSLRRMVGTCQDITEAKLAEQALRESEQRFRVMGEALAYGVWLSDEQGRIEYVSKSFLDLLGMSMEQVRNLGWADALAREDRAAAVEAWQECIRHGEDIDSEHRILGADGRYHTVLVRGKPVKDSQGRTIGWAGINLDIDDRKKMEDQLRRSQRELRGLAATLERRVMQRTRQLEDKSNRLRGLAAALANAERRERERLAGVIHDHLQQILVAARMRVQLASHGRPEQAAESLVRASSLMDEAIQAARSLSTELRPPVLYEDGLIAALHWLAGRAEDQFQLRVDLDLSPEAEPRSGEMRAILFESVRELLFNISKHAGVARARIELSRTNEGREIMLAVEDEGAGFDPVHAETDGGGLGLFQIRERMIALGGQTDVDSVPGRGTRIVLVAPEEDVSLVPVEQTGLEQRADQQVPDDSGVTAGLIRVVVADDHRMVREGLVMLLENQPDISVVGQANDGREALNLTRQTRPDVVIMDVNMPEMNGIEATRVLRREFPDVLVIAVSAYGEAGTAEPMLSAGAVAYLEKGGDPDELVLAVRQHLSGRPVSW